MKLFDSEWKVMEVLWQQNDQTAKEVSLHLAQSAGWNKNTTYTVIKKCIDKGAIERREPNFVCHALISKQQHAQHDFPRLFHRTSQIRTVKICPTARNGLWVRKKRWCYGMDT